MHKKTNNPIISDEFLDQVVKEINAEFGGPINEKNDRFQHRDDEERRS
ncbi:bacitracin ABC transporter ATP-binding protein [Peribacillus frigoritolerans]